MIFNNDTDKNGVILSQLQPMERALPDLGRKDMASRQASPAQRPRAKTRRRIIVLTSIILLIALVLATIRMLSITSGTNDQLLVQIGNQQTAVVDLRQSLPISPYLYGVNVFPEIRTSSVDRPFSGFMYYTPPVVEGLKSTHVNLLRFPGGNWGENHILSLSQLYAFCTLIQQTGAEGMIQARLSSPIDANGQFADLATRANLAGNWVGFMNRPKSYLRTSTGDKYKGCLHPVNLWSVGNEPDVLPYPTPAPAPAPPAHKAYYTVTQYVTDFIQYSLAMHQNDPTIKVFGPELSQFFGVGVGPKDSNGQLWMEQFLQGVSAYEQAHHVQLLDGVSFHRYPFPDASQDPSLLLSASAQWNYLLPPLRQLIRRDFGRDLPLAITEINTNPRDAVPTRGNAALWWADNLGTLMNQQVEYVGFFSTEGVKKPYPLFDENGLAPKGGVQLQQTPMLRVMQLFSHMQNNLIPVNVQREPVSVYATQDDTHQTVSLMFINKSNTPQLVQISAASQLFNTSPWHNLDVRVGGDSMVVIVLHRGGGAEYYAFQVPAQNDPTTGPLGTDTCGRKTDALDNSTPC